LPDFQLYDPWITNQVTIRDMLCHRTGTKRCIRLLYKDRVFDSTDQLRRMEFLQPASGFREQFGYNNPHYIVAGKIAEKVSGKSWSELVRSCLFNPLDMNNSFTCYQEMRESNSKNVSSPHANLSDDFVPAELRVLDPVKSIPWPNLGQNPAGAIISNLKDLTAWLMMLIDQGNYAGKEILSQTTFNQMVSPQMVIKPGESEMDPIFAVGLASQFLSYGFGWYLMDFRGYKMVFHPGQLHGFVSAVAFLPELRIGGVILLNTYHTMLHPMLGFYIFDAMLGIERDYSQEMLGMAKQWRFGAEKEIGAMLSAKPKNEGMPVALEKFTGVYSSSLYGEIEILLENENLVHRYGETDLFTGDLELWQGSTFVIKYRNKLNQPEFLTFNQDESGRIHQLIIKDVDTFDRIS